MNGTCVDSNNDELFDAFLDHPAFRDLTEANLTLANFEMASPRVKCPAGYKKENKLLRYGSVLAVIGLRFFKKLEIF